MLKRVKSILGFFLLTMLLTSVIDIIAITSNYIPVLNRMSTSFFDWDIPDLIYSSNTFKKVKAKSSKITLINWENIDRKTTAQTIEEVKKNKPRVLGLDGLFLVRKDSLIDDKLGNSLQGVNLVMPIELKKWDSQKQMFLESVKPNDVFMTTETTLGYNMFSALEDESDIINKIYGSDEPTLRKFTAGEKIDNDTIYHFAFELVKRYDPRLFDTYLKKINFSKNVYLRYWGDSSLFKILSYKDILSKKYSPQDLTDRIVIFTFLGDSDDPARNNEEKKLTPLNLRIIGRNEPDTYRGVIHANIILSILNNVYIQNASPYTVGLTELIIVIFYVYLLDYIRVKRKEKLPLYSRLIAYSFVILIVGLNLLFYFKLNYRIDFRTSLFYVLALPELYLFYINRFLPFFKESKIKVLTRVSKLRHKE